MALGSEAAAGTAASAGPACRHRAAAALPRRPRRAGTAAQRRRRAGAAPLEPPAQAPFRGAAGRSGRRWQRLRRGGGGRYREVVRRRRRRWAAGRAVSSRFLSRRGPSARQPIPVDPDVPYCAGCQNMQAHKRLGMSSISKVNERRLHGASEHQLYVHLCSGLASAELGSCAAVSAAGSTATQPLLLGSAASGTTAVAAVPAPARGAAAVLRSAAPAELSGRASASQR